MRRASLFFGLMLGTCLLAQTASAAPPDPQTGAPRKPAWQWTAEERIAARVNPEAIKARAAERLAERQAMLQRHPLLAADPAETGTAQPSGTVSDTIEGRKNPELFLPMELFGHLLEMGFPPEGIFQDESRPILEERAIALGFGRDLWRRLEKVATPYLKLEREHEQLALARLAGTGGDEKRENSLQPLICPAKAAALKAAKTEFGEEAFLRLLYVGVTPTFSISYNVEEGLADNLRYLEGGCR